MKKLLLQQLVKLNTGVVSRLIGEGLELYGLETQDCLPEGEYLLECISGKYVFEDGYKIDMNANGRYRNPCLVLGTEFRFDSFDLMKKGDAIQELWNWAGGKDINVCVVRSEMFSIKPKPEPELITSSEDKKDEDVE